MAKEAKTNAMRMLDRQKVKYEKLIIKSPIFYEEKATDMSCFMSAAFFFTEERFRQKIFTKLFFHLLSA